MSSLTFFLEDREPGSRLAEEPGLDSLEGSCFRSVSGSLESWGRRVVGFPPDGLPGVLVAGLDRTEGTVLGALEGSDS